MTAIKKNPQFINGQNPSIRSKVMRKKPVASDQNAGFVSPFLT
jgi:hypothetical protein